MKTRRILGATATAVVGVAMLAACSSGGSSAASAGSTGSGSTSGSSVPTLTFGAFPGTQTIALFAMQSQHLDTKNGFKLDIKSFQTVPALDAAVISGSVNAGWAGATDVAIARSQGKDVLSFNGLLGPSEVVLVPKNSTLTNFSQLKGKKLSSFGGTTSSAFDILAASAKKKYGMTDPAKDIDVLTAPDAAALGLLDRGEVQASLISSGGIVPAMLTGKYKILVKVADFYKEEFNGQPCEVVGATTQSWASANKAELTDFSTALAQSISYVQSTASVWQSYATSVKQTDPKAPALYQQYVGNAFLSKWDQTTISTQEQFLNQLIGVLGASNFVSSVPAGLYTTAYGSR
jgi:ABC-type nitrate/sulfonate/bicarbonate transport system substrate-binding protein